MTHQALARHPVVGVAGRHRQPRSAVVQFITDRFLLLPLGAAIAFVWANTAGESYFRFAHAAAFAVNEIGMALFLGLMVQESLEGVMPGGALHSARRWAMPLVAAAGGVAGAALTYVGYVSLSHEQVLVNAWPIVCAIDVAAGYYVLKLIYGRSSTLPFLLVLALATDAAGLMLMASWRPLSLGHVAGAGLLLMAVGSAALLRRRGVRSFWPFLAICGPLAWFAFYLAGVHPALALVPIVPFLWREPRGLDLFVEPPVDGAVHQGEHEWHQAVQVVLFLFGLVNAGVVVGGYDTGTWGVLAAALVGRPVGILVAVALGVAMGLHLPRRFGWRELVVVALATSSGFTLALFFANGLLPVGAVLQQVKLGALGTVAGAMLTLGVARLLAVGRFARRRR